MQVNIRPKRRHVLRALIRDSGHVVLIDDELGSGRLRGRVNLGDIDDGAIRDAADRVDPEPALPFTLIVGLTATATKKSYTGGYKRQAAGSK